MNDEIVQLRVPYTQDYIPVGRRKPRSVDFWSEGQLPIHIRKIDAAEAPPVYRIVRTDEQSSPNPYIVRSFAGFLWWPLLTAEGFVSPSQFVALAGEGDPSVLAALGVRRGWPDERTPDEFYKDHPYKKIVACTRDRQWANVQRGAAERVVFCGETVLLEAGEPIYFVVPPWAPTRYKIMAGTSSLDRNPGYKFHLAGPSSIAALDSARHGLAFSIEEIDDGICRLAHRTSDGYGSKIERLVERYRSNTAVLACAGAFIDLLWLNAQLDHPRSRLLLKTVPCLAEAGRDIERIRRRPHQEVLEQVISIADPAALREFSSEIRRATDIMRRLTLLCPTPLAEEDDAALWRLG
jgi:hypothetical protein